MVFKSIELMKKALPELTHVVMFYDEGIVYQTTFEQPINIPQLGKDLAKSLDHFQRLFETLQLPIKAYKKLIFEVEDFVIIILKLGEHSNLALFFQGGVGDFKLSAIRRYLFRIEELIDTDQIEIERQNLKNTYEKLDGLELEIQTNLEIAQQKKNEIMNLDKKIEKIKQEIEAKEVEQLYEDTIQEKLEIIVDLEEEKLQTLTEPSVKGSVKADIEEGKKGIKLLEKTQKEKDEIVERLKQEIDGIEKRKLEILSEINSLLERNKEIKEDITQLNAEATNLKEKIKQLHTKKYEEKFVD